MSLLTRFCCYRFTAALPACLCDCQTRPCLPADQGMKQTDRHKPGFFVTSLFFFAEYCISHAPHVEYSIILVGIIPSDGACTHTFTNMCVCEGYKQNF